eukprot:g65057.t1
MPSPVQKVYKHFGEEIGRFIAVCRGFPIAQHLLFCKQGHSKQRGEEPKQQMLRISTLSLHKSLSRNNQNCTYAQGCLRTTSAGCAFSDFSLAVDSPFRGPFSLT